jgi:Helix-turn-helix domain
VARKQDKERNDRYFQLHHYMLRTDAWQALSAAAVRVYIQIGSRYNGANNGKLAFSVRDAAAECNLAINTAMRALRELVDLGFIEETRHGGLSKKTRIASEWRLTAFKCDLTGSLKTCAFMHRGDIARAYRANYQRPGLSQTRSASVSKEITACLKRGADMTPSISNEITDTPLLGPSPVSNEVTHIVYQSLGTDSTAKGSPERPADTAVAAPVVDLIEDAFRIGERRIELRRSAAVALSLTAGQLAQHLAASHPSNADKPVRPRLTVIAAAPPPAIAAE